MKTIDLKIIELRCLGKLLREIAKILGCSRGHVQYICEKHNIPSPEPKPKKRIVVTKDCLFCGKIFELKSKRQKYCSPECGRCKQAELRVKITHLPCLRCHSISVTKDGTQLCYSCLHKQINADNPEDISYDKRRNA